MFEAVADVLASFAAWQPPVENGAFDPTTRHREVGTGATYTRGDERAILLAMARDADEKLTREALYNRIHGGIEEAPVVDTEAVQSDRAIGFSTSWLRPAARARGSTRPTGCHDRPWSDKGVGRFRLARGGLLRGAEWSTSWTLGPDRADIVRHLADAGNETQDGNIVALRAAYLQLFADLLFDAERRYRSAKSAVDEVIVSLRNANALMQERPDERATSERPLMVLAEIRQNPLPAPGILSDAGTTPSLRPPATSIESGSERSFTGRVEALARQRERAKREGQPDGWDPKTSAQHRSLADVFVKLAGTDDPGELARPISALIATF